MTGTIALIAACLAIATPQESPTCCPSFTREGGWQLAGLDRIRQPKKARQTLTRHKDGLVITVRLFASGERVSLPRLGSGCGGDNRQEQQGTYVASALIAYYCHGRPYAIQLRLEEYAEGGGVGCQTIGWLLDRDGDGLFETLAADCEVSDAAGLPDVPGWLTGPVAR